MSHSSSPSPAPSQVVAPAPAVSAHATAASTQRVPLVDLAAQYAELKPAIDAAVLGVLASGRYVLGPEVDAFEADLAAYLSRGTAGTAPSPAGGPFVIAVSSGSDALLAAAMGLGLGLGCGLGEHGHDALTQPATRVRGEVLTTAFSFFATPETAIRLGLRPVFADLEEDGFNADVDDLLRKVSDQTVAILPVHLFGQRMALDRLVATGLPVIEDAAQTLVPGLATQTRCATLSFFPTKNLGAAGDGGAIVTYDAALADSLRVMRQHGSRPKYVHSLWGGNFRLDPLQAAILRIKLAHLDAWQATRRRHAALYHQALAPLKQAGTLRLPPSPQQAPEHVYHHFVIRAPRRDALRAHLAARQIETELYYPLPLHLQPCLAALGYRPGSLPRAEAAAAECLALPVHANLSPAQIAAVSTAVLDFYQR